MPNAVWRIRLTAILVGRGLLMSEDILFSVVIPAYNAERFIGETIQSVLDQSYSAFEIIVVDDASEDTTRQIAEDFKDKRVKVYSLECNSGHAAAPRNYAILKSQGSFIAFLDADDLWLPQKLEIFCNFIEQTNAQFMFSNGFIIDENDTAIKKMLPPRIKKNVLLPKEPLLLMTNFVPNSSVVVCKDIIQNKRFAEDKRFRGVEDYGLWLQLNQEFSIYYIQEALFKYRIHDNMISRDYRGQLEQHSVVLNEIKKANTYSEDLLELALCITDLKQLYAQGQKLSILAKSIEFFWRTSYSQKKALLEYTKYLYSKWRTGAYIPYV